MTQTLMNFVQLMADGDATPVSPKHPAPNDFANWRLRFRSALKALNAQLADRTGGGQLIATPLCPAACDTGSLQAVLQTIGTHPYDSWNMMLYADTPATARKLNTIAFHPDYVTDTNAAMVDYIMGLRHNAQAPLQRLRDDSAKIQATLFGDQVSWANYIDLTAEPDAPKADISVFMSVGIGAANDKSAFVAG